MTTAGSYSLPTLSETLQHHRAPVLHHTWCTPASVQQIQRCVAVVGDMSCSFEKFNCFSSPYRRCGDCSKLLTKGNYSFCGKCKVFVYCNQDCQAKHWKSQHKATCKTPTAALPPPAAYPPFDLTAVPDGEHGDLDRPYRFIHVSPPPTGAKLTKEEWQNTVCGVADEAVVAALIERALTTEPKEVGEAVDKLRLIEFGWERIGRSSPPGYTARFNGYTLLGIYDDCFRTRQELGLNAHGAYIYHEDPAKWHGNLVLCCTANIADLESGGEVLENPLEEEKHEKVMFLTRRQVLDMIEYHLQCGGEYGAVPDRIRHENICRAAALKVFKNEKFYTLPS